MYEIKKNLTKRLFLGRSFPLRGKTEIIFSRINRGAHLYLILSTDHRLLFLSSELRFAGAGAGGVDLGGAERSAARWRTSLSRMIVCFDGVSPAFFHVF